MSLKDSPEDMPRSFKDFLKITFFKSFLKNLTFDRFSEYLLSSSLSGQRSYPTRAEIIRDDFVNKHDPRT